MAFGFLLHALPILLRGALLTLWISVLALAAATILGVIGAVLRTSRLAVLRAVGTAYTEVFRAGLEAVPRGLHEAAAALGLSAWQRFRLVVLPVALRIVLPALGNNFVALVKNSSLASTIGLVELTFLARDLEAWTFRSFEVYGLATLIYLGLVVGLSLALRRVEVRITRHLRTA